MKITGKKKKNNSGGRKGETTSWGWYLFNFVLQDSIFSRKPTKHMFEFNFLNYKVKYMLFWILSPNICLVFSTHLFCSNWGISKVLLCLDAGQTFCWMPSGFLKMPPGKWYCRLWKTMELTWGGCLGKPKRRGRMLGSHVYLCHGATVCPWTSSSHLGLSFSICRMISLGIWWLE